MVTVCDEMHGSTNRLARHRSCGCPIMKRRRNETDRQPISGSLK
jgi:hypothetical protein